MWQVQLLGAKHLLWDKIAVEISKLWVYAYFMEDKRILAGSTLTKCQIVNENLHMIPINKAHNTINFLNETSNETLRALGVKDRFAIIIWDKIFIEKHNMVNNGKAKVEKMNKEVQ